MREGRVRVWSFTAIILCILLLVPAIGFAQTGKIRGTVVDAENGDPLAGANVVIEGTSRGAATDLDGLFFIVGVPVGSYTVRATYAGYQAVTITDVRIATDRTTELEFRMSSEAIQLEEVVVVFEAPEVELEVTSSATTVSGEDLQMMAVDDVQQMLTTIPGIKIDEEGRIHIRGGRETEARFIVNGIDSRDPITGEVLPVNLAAVNVQEIQVLTGGMSPEYGQAMSGMVTITTPEGAPDRYNGSVEWSTDQWSGNESFGQDRIDAAVGGPVPLTANFLGRPLTFYVTGNMNISDTHAPLDIDYDPEDYLGLGFDVPRRQYNDWSGSLKLAYDMGSGRKISAYFNERRRAYDVYPNGSGFVSGNYGWQYKYNLDNRPMVDEARHSFNIDFTNQISSHTLLTVSFGRSVLDVSLSPRNTTPGDYTLVNEIEDFIATGLDQDNNGRWDQDADGDGVIHSDALDELAFDNDGNGYLDGFFDANNNYIYDGGGEGYEDLDRDGTWDRGEDWIDLNGNGVYDFAEPWTDRADPVTGQNNVGVYDAWDPYVDLNGNGMWDPAEPQLLEQDTNGNGRWDGERFQDSNDNGIFDRWEPFEDLNGNFTWDPGEPFIDYNGNGVQDDGEGYDDSNLSGFMDSRDVVDDQDTDQDEPFWDGDLFNDTGEPFIDLPDPLTGQYNGSWDPGEPFWDLPSSNTGQFFFAQGDGIFLFSDVLGVPTLNGQYDAPNGYFDEYELFTRWSGNPAAPVGYTYDLDQHGAEWVYDNFMVYNPLHSTWVNRTLHDTESPEFNPPNFIYDEGEERYIDYNGNGEWNSEDLFLNPGTYDPAAVWIDRRTEEYTFRASWQSQIHENHELKFGTEMKYYIMENQEIQGPDQTYTGDASVDPNEPWPDRGSVRDFWEYQPFEGAFYFQDLMEFQGLIVMGGARADFVIHDQEVVDEQRRRFENNEPGAVEAERGSIQFSPRLGISHPITAESKLYFNYGHFYQRPSFTYYYKSTTTNIDQGTVGNPNLKYEKTVTYELGVHTQVSRNLTVQIAGYYRDIYNMISTVAERVGPITIYRYINMDYGRTRGLEVKVEKTFADHWQFSFNYDFSYAYGKASSANAEFERRTLNVPVNYDEHPLDWDETHRVTLNSAFMYGPDEFPVFFGFRVPVDNWLLTLQWQFGSGRPFTPSQYSTGIDPNLILENSDRMPWTETTNVRFEKYFDVGSLKMIVGFDVRNLFDKQNWNTLYEETGSPYYAVHPLNPDYNPFQNRYEFDANPRNFGPGRQIFLTFGIEF